MTVYEDLRDETAVPVLADEALRAGRLYDGNFVLAIVAQTMFTLANTLMAHYNRWIEFLEGNLVQIGWIMGVGSIVAPLLRPWMGLLMNRIGSRATWNLGFIIFGIGSLGNLWVTELGWAIYALRSCLVVGAAVVFSSSLTYITLTTPAQRRTEAIGILGAGGFLGMLLGPLLGDLILGDGSRARGDFQLLFSVTTLAVVLPAVLVFSLRRPALKPQKSSLRIGEFVRTIWVHWPGTILLCCFAFGVCMTVPFAFLASYVDQLKLQIPGLSVVGLYFGCYAGWGLTVRVGLRRLPDRIGRRKVLIAGMLTMAAGMFCFASVSAAHPWRLAIGAGVFSARGPWQRFLTFFDHAGHWNDCWRADSWKDCGRLRIRLDVCFHRSGLSECGPDLRLLESSSVAQAPASSTGCRYSVVRRRRCP